MDEEPVRVRIHADVLAQMLSHVMGWYEGCEQNAQRLAVVSKQLSGLEKRGFKGHVEFDAYPPTEEDKVDRFTTCVVEEYEHGYELVDEKGRPVRIEGASATFFPPGR